MRRAIGGMHDGKGKALMHVVRDINKERSTETQKAK